MDDSLINKEQFHGIVNDAQKRLIIGHQKNEFTKVDRHQEGYCFGCSKKNFVTPTIVDICIKCAYPRPMEALLAIVVRNPWGYCYFCRKYTHNVAQINAHFCMPCTQKIRLGHKEVRHKGDMFQADPFWIYQRKKWGKDFKELMWQDTYDRSVRS